MSVQDINNTSYNYSAPQLDHFLVCGLGSLGQHCVKALAEFGVKVIAIEQISPVSWEINFLPNLLESLIIGDCRQKDSLKQAQIQQCRAALIVTSNEQINIETALAIRQNNSQTRLVVRSGKSNLNQLLSYQLGNFIAFDCTELPTSAFALAALGTEILGLFKLNGKVAQVYQRYLQTKDAWCDRYLVELETHNRKILAHYRSNHNLAPALGKWNPNELMIAGDTVIYLEIDAEFNPYNFCLPRISPTRNNQTKSWQFLRSSVQKIFNIVRRFNLRQQIRRLALVYLVIVLLLLIIGTLLFNWYYPEITLLSAFLATAILLLGGYGDLFSELEDITLIPWWLRLFSLGLTVVGTAFVGVLYALLTEALLSSRLFLQQRLPIPQKYHVVIVGMGRVGQKVAQLLQQFKQSLVGITENCDFYQQYSGEIPLILGKLTQALPQAHLKQAKSVVIVTDDEILNLEAALMIQQINPKLNLVIRTSGLRLCEHLSELLPEAQVLGVYAVTAAAFAGAAFGENILNLFRLGKDTVLVTEYDIETGDTLNGLLLADITYGYGVTPILYHKQHQDPILLPYDDFRLHIGEKLVFLATIEGLRRIEQGNLNLALKCWQVIVEKALTTDAIFEGANVISRISGCNLALARTTMDNLPQTLSIPLYQYQAQRLVRELRKVLVIAHVHSNHSSTNH
ncbi:MAG: NAD-binding protein [Xenococcaceae cyanobacterium MO_167.B27]|nr:NAD-binding protein [Xenococcaceae cyanobacterium MO_167.B27]